MDVHSPEEVPRLTPEELKRKLAAGENVLLLDVRTAHAYQTSATEIRGALRVDPQDIEVWAENAPRDREIALF